MWIYSKRLDFLLLRKVRLPITEGVVRMPRSRVNKKQSSLSNTITVSCNARGQQLSPNHSSQCEIHLAWDDGPLKSSISECTSMFLFRCSRGEHGVLFLTQLWSDADLQLALLIHRIHGYTAFFGKTQQ